MLQVDLSVLFTVAGGFAPTTRGTVTVEYWAGDGRADDVDGEMVRFSVPIVVDVTGAPLIIELVPTYGVRCARWTIEDHDHPDRFLERFTELPDVARISFGELVRVDPETFVPSGEGLAAWLAAIAAVQSVLAETRTVATDVEVTAVEVERNAAAAAEFERQAGEHAGAADDSRAAALGYADSAGVSAVAAAGAEGRASGFADDAEGHARSAGASAGEAADRVVDAEAQVALAAAQVDLAAAQVSLARDERLAAAGFATAADDSRGAAVIAQAAAAGSATLAGQYLTATEAARDLALAGQFAGAALGTEDLNTIQTPGVRYQAANLDAATALARNYPTGGGGGVLEVHRIAAGRYQQRYTVLYGNASSIKGIYIRRLYDGTWTAWAFMPSQTVDTAAGRAFHTWDSANNRPQRTYGDTGIRNISSLLTPSFTGGVNLRRKDDLVQVWGEITPTADIAANAEPDITTFSLAGGFSANQIGWVRQGFLLSGGALQAFVRISSPLTVRSPTLWPQSQILRFMLVWLTNDPWPTTLPGTASGSIIST